MRLPSLRTAVSSLAVAVAVFGALEAAVRLLPAERKRPDPRASMPAFGDAVGEEILADTARLRVEYAPFVLWRLAPNQSGRHFSIDERGFRGRQPGCGEGSYRILLLGGSQAWGVGATSDRTTIAGYLEEAMTPTGRKVCVMNAAEPGYVLRQERIQLFNGLLKERWDVVLILSGFNDVLAALQNRAVGDVQNSHRFRERFGNDPDVWDAGRDFLRQLLLSSRLLERLGGPLTRPSPARAAAAFSRSDGVEGLEALLAEMAREYVYDARTIAVLCRERGIRVTFVLESCLPVDKPATPAEQAALLRLSEKYPLYVPAIRLGYKHLREALARAAGEGLDFIDGSKVFEHDQSDVYIDEIHMTDRGNRAVAELLRLHEAPRALAGAR